MVATKLTDIEHAQAIQAARQNLDNAMNEAAGAGLIVEVDVRETKTYYGGTGGSYPAMQISLSRPIHA